jgi:hypothetical protein
MPGLNCEYYEYITDSNFIKFGFYYIKALITTYLVKKKSI